MTETQRFQVDIEHSGLRLAVMGSFIAGTIAAFFIISVLLTGQSLLTAVLALVVGALLSVAVERALKGRWPSGRELHIDPAGVRLLRKGQLEMAIDSAAGVELLRWRFQPRKRGRVPKNGYLIALAVKRDEELLAVYTVVTAEQFEAEPDHALYKALISEKQSKTAAEDIRLAGEQRRLREAEAFRWNFGAELTPDDFFRFARHVQTIFS